MAAKRIGDTGDEATQLAKGALLELFERFPALREKTSVTGGIAVAEQLPNVANELGPLNTADVDLLVSLAVAKDCPNIRASLLASKQYCERTDRGNVVPYSFLRKGPTPAKDVQIDFQGEEYGGVKGIGNTVKVQPVGDLPTRMTVGADLALKHCVDKEITGVVPDNRILKGKVRLTCTFILVPMKAIAFVARGLSTVDPKYRRVKDAGDLYALLRFDPAKPAGLAKAVKPYRGRTLLQDAVACLKNHFTSRKGEGINALVEFLQGRREEDLVRTEMLELVDEYLRGL